MPRGHPNKRGCGIFGGIYSYILGFGFEDSGEKLPSGYAYIRLI